MRAFPTKGRHCLLFFLRHCLRLFPTGPPPAAGENQVRYLVCLLLAFSLAATVANGLKGKAERFAEVRADRMAEAEGQ